MEKFDYIIVTEENTWEGTGKNATQKDLDDDLAEIRERLGLNDESEPVELIVYRAPVLETFTV